MVSEQFQNELREMIVSQFIEGRNESSSFLMWFLENIFGISRQEAVDSVCDNNGDKGIDGIYVDNVEGEVHIFQSKFKQNNSREFGDRDLRDFHGVSIWFSSSEAVKQLKDATINQELKSLIITNSLENIIDDYSVKYHFVCNGIKDYNAVEYENANENLIIWDLDSINKYYSYVKDDPLVQHTIEINSIKKDEKILLSRESGKRIIIFPIKATDILKFNGIVDYTLFNKNVRYGLGNTRVNKSIKSTLEKEDDKKDFIIYHNGISLVCEGFIYDDEQEKLQITNYSIVNGAQSTLTFYRNDQLLNDNIKVLIKVIEVGNNPNLMDKITINSNNQNAIRMKDLRSNDKVQKRIEREFEELNERYNIMVTYVAKEGKLNPNGYTMISSDYAAQLISACYLKASYHTHLKTSMFTSNYQSIFNRNINAGLLFLYYRCHKKLTDNLYKIEDRKIATYGLAQYFILSIVFDVLDIDPISKNLLINTENTITNLDKYDLLICKLIDIICNVFNHFVRQLKIDSEFDYKNFFKSKEKSDKLMSEIKTMFSTSLSLSGTTFKEICTTSLF